MKKTIVFHDGTTATADCTKRGVLAVHRATDRGYTLTDVATLGIVGVWRLKGSAVAVRKQLEAADRAAWPGILADAFLAECAQ